MLVLPAFIGISLLSSVAGLPRADGDVPPPTRQLARRDLASDFANIVGQIPEDVFGHLMPGSMKIPSEDQVKNNLGLNDSYIASLPTQILNIPGYANWTGQNWNVRLHGATYVQPAPSNETLDDLAEDFLPDIEQSQYNQTMRDQSRNLTGALYALPRKEVPLAFNVVYNEQQIANILYPYPSDDHGEFEGFVPIQTTAIPSGEGRKGVQAAVVYAQGGQNGNSSTYFVSQNGVTIIADIDDILRETKIYVPKLGLENSFAYKFRIWDGMNELLHQWQRDDLSMHFHYLTTTPEQATRTYMDFIYANYPFGSFDIRPYNFTTVDQTFSIRRVNLIRILETYPNRTFVLLADTSNNDVMRVYPEMATLFPGRIQCILLRNTSATDPQMKFPYDTSGFRNLDNSTYMFFRTSDDLRGINFSNGGCRNPDVPQNVTFSYQEVPSLSDINTILGNSAHIRFAVPTAIATIIAFASLLLFI